MKKYLAVLLVCFGSIIVILSFYLLFAPKNISPGITTKGLRLKAFNENINNYISSQMHICYMSHNNVCYQDLASLLMRQFSLPQVLSILQNNEQKPEISASCHGLTHFLSRIEYDNKKNISAVYNECTPVCHGGCYHGAIEAYLKDKKTETFQSGTEFMKKFIPLVCGKFYIHKLPRVYDECIHNLGHAAMFVNNGDISVALNTCDYLSTTPDRESCYAGVFMENVSNSTNEITFYQTKYTKSDDILYPCDILDKKYLSTCYSFQSSYFAFLAGWDWQKVGQSCLKIPKEYQQNCFWAIGSSQVVYTQDISLIKRNCENLPADALDQCIIGVIDSFTGQFFGDTSRVINFCEMFDSRQKQLCYQRFGNGVAFWLPKKGDIIKMCNQLPSQQARNWCINS